MTDHNEAMRLAQALKNRQEVEDDAADMLRQQAERIAELEGERDQLRAEVETLRGISDEYNHWVRFHAAGDGDFDDFIVTHCRHAESRTQKDE